jgi:transglutaminase-like putative cysteine protease
LSILLEKDSLKVFTEVTEDLLVLKEQAEMFVNKKVYGSHFNQVKNIAAKTLVWDKNRYRSMDVSDFKKNSDRDKGIFFDDSYYYSFNFPSVASQNRTQLSYSEDIKDARFISGYIFPSYVPLGKVSYTIKTSKGVDLFYEVFNDPNKKIKMKVTEKGGNIFYEWTAQNLEGLKVEEKSPPVRYYAPQLVCYVKSYTNKKGKVNVLTGVDDLYRWYYTFIKDLNKDKSQELTDVVLKLKSESKSELDFVRRVYYWVQDNIQYIAFEQGMRGLIPHSGSYVCEKRFGDCKDMANLIVAMLQLASVKAYHTWIGTRDIPYQYTKLPTPLVDNHMIATYVTQDGKYYFLDGTDDYLPFGMPSSMIQGKEALIGFDSVHYEIKTVPVIDKSVNVMTDSMLIKINDNLLVGTGKSSLNGYAKDFGAYQLNRADEEEVKKYVTRLIGKGNNKFFLDNYKLKDLADKDKPTRIAYSFRIGDYFQKVGNEIYLNINLNKEFYNDFINADTRRTPKENDYQYVKHEYIEFEIPSNYVIEYLPPSVTFDNGILGYDIRYSSKAGKIIFEKMLFLNYLLLEPAQFTSWNAAVTQVSEVYKESVILKKK